MQALRHELRGSHVLIEPANLDRGIFIYADNAHVVNVSVAPATLAVVPFIESGSRVM